MMLWTYVLGEKVSIDKISTSQIFQLKIEGSKNITKERTYT